MRKNLLSLLIIVLFTTSCKKEIIEETRPKTFDDFQKIMEKDLDIQSLIITTNLLQQQIFSSRLNLIKVEKTTSLNTNNLTVSKNMLTKQDIEQYFVANNILNANSKANLIEKQLTHFKKFIDNYPEFSKLNKPEIIKLLEKVIQKSKINQNPIGVIASTGSIGIPKKTSDCAQSWSRAVSGCETAYNLALIAIWADVAIASSLSAGFAAVPALASALAATGIVYAASEYCISYATDEFYTCF